MDRRKFIGLIPAAAAIPFLPKSEDDPLGLLGGKEITFVQDFTQRWYDPVDEIVHAVPVEPVTSWSFEKLRCAEYRGWSVCKLIWSYEGEPYEPEYRRIKLIAEKTGQDGWRCVLVHKDYIDSITDRYGAVCRAVWALVKKPIDQCEDLGVEAFDTMYKDRSLTRVSNSV